MRFFVCLLVQFVGGTDCGILPVCLFVVLFLFSFFFPSLFRLVEVVHAHLHIHFLFSIFFFFTFPVYGVVI